MKNIVLSVLGLSLACSMMLSASARDVSGKVVAVYHEPVVINTKTLDKVSVSVLSCAGGQWETLSYSPGAVSDDNSLGFLFDDLANSARLSVTKSQYMNSVSGHVTLAVNEQNVVQKTTFWGYNWECGKDIEGVSAGASASGSSSPAAAQPAGKASPMGKLGKFGF